MALTVTRQRPPRGASMSRPRGRPMVQRQAMPGTQGIQGGPLQPSGRGSGGFGDTLGRQTTPTGPGAPGAPNQLDPWNLLGSNAAGVMGRTQIQGAYDTAMGQLQGRQDTIERGFGGFDAQGNALDTGNPYSRAQLLQQAWKRAQQGTLTDMGAAGQVFSGAHARAQQYDLQNQEADRNQFAADKQAELDKLASDRAGAATDRAAGLTNLAYDLMGSRLANLKDTAALSDFAKAKAEGAYSGGEDSRGMYDKTKSGNPKFDAAYNAMPLAERQAYTAMLGKWWNTPGRKAQPPSPQAWRQARAARDRARRT